MILPAATSPPPRATVGGKAAGLYRLRAAGVRVPDFLVIPAEAFDPALRGLPPDDAAGRGSALRAFTLPEADQAALTAALAAWGFPSPASPVAVRSSIADEDGAQAAFPGLMESVLNVTTRAALDQAIARCAASAYATGAGAYRQQKGLMPAARPAVVVQRQVAAAASGVLFSTFPEYPQELAIHAVRGFGEGLVGGHLAADEFYFHRATGELHRQVIVPKPEQWLPTAADVPGLAPAPVPVAEQGAPALSPTQLATLYAEGRRLEELWRGPLDIEFVTDAAGAVWLVQARPITQPIPEVVVYDNANIQESYYGVTTPLTFSFARRAYATVYRQTMRMLGLPQEQVNAYEPVITHLLALVRGRVYYHINNWYRGLQLLPSFRQNKADMERMMGLTEPVDFVRDREKTLPEKLRLLPRLTLNLSRLLVAFTRLPASIRRFQAHFQTQYAWFYATPPAALPAAELLRRRARLDHELLLRWTTPIVNDFRVMMANGTAHRLLRAAGIAAPDDFLSGYLSSDPTLASAQPAHAMQRLATEARQAPPALRELVLAAPADLPAQVQARFPAFHQQVAAFIEAYGDRTIGELKLETRTMRTAPGLFYAYLRNFLVADLPTTRPGSDGPAAQAAAELKGRLARRSPVFRWRVRRALGRLQQAIRDRETLRLERTRLFGMYRALYDALGARLTEANQLAAAADVYYLTEDELTTAGGALSESPPPDTPDLRALVAARRAEFAAYAAEEPPPGRVTVPAPPLNSPPEQVAPPGTLRGTGCFAGQATAEVIVITDPARDGLAVAGRIVAAARTDPGWAALFPTCRGVLIERGSALSHSVILLRELGIPTIINIPHLTRTLRTGQQVWMDGATGEVRGEKSEVRGEKSEVRMQP